MDTFASVRVAAVKGILGVDLGGAETHTRTQHLGPTTHALSPMGACNHRQTAPLAKLWTVWSQSASEIELKGVMMKMFAPVAEYRAASTSWSSVWLDGHTSDWHTREGKLLVPVLAL